MSRQRNSDSAKVAYVLVYGKRLTREQADQAFAAFRWTEIGRVALEASELEVRYELEEAEAAALAEEQEEQRRIDVVRAAALSEARSAYQAAAETPALAEVRLAYLPSRPELSEPRKERSADPPLKPIIFHLGFGRFGGH